MKQYLFLATTIATASLFTGCSNNEYVGDQPEAFNGTDGAIVFSMGKANTTRGTLDAAQSADKLKNRFYVYGEKYIGTPETSEKRQTVFNTYKVQYKPSDNDKSASNTQGWEYVGNLWTNENERNNVGGGVVNQTIKYWDYTASKYNFLAFSAAAADLSGGKIKVNKDPGADIYTVDIQTDADIEKLYFADRVEIAKPGTPSGTPVDTDKPNDYGGYVKFTFRNLAAKVRVGFYETVPGYKIQIKKMYAGANGSQTEKTDKFLADCPNTEASQKSKITVTYITEEGETKNRAFVSEKNDAVNTTTPLSEKSELTLGGGVFNPYLATTSSSPTWDNGGNYTFFWPQKNDNNNPLKIKVDYTLTSTDGSGETIEVKGATAAVPADYIKWKANTAYTYIFKISDNTNGTTGTPGDPAGLYPITFDAVVEDYANEGSTTTVSTPSVTAKQDGATTGYVDASGIVFKTGKTIDLKVVNGNNTSDNPVISGNYIEGVDYNYNYDLTPEENLEKAGHSISDSISGTQLSAQSNAGYWVLKVQYSSTETNVFTYVIIRVGKAEKYPANP